MADDQSSTGTPDWSAIPAPIDDGGAAHLAGASIASVALETTRGRHVDLAVLPGITVVYAYPRTGRPGVPNADGWDLIPGARGCSPQSCSFRDHFGELQSYGVANVFGLSTQDTAYQREAAERLHLPFEFLSDADLALTRAMTFPTFEVQGLTLLKRFTLVIREGVIAHVFYPVFPPDQNAAEVVGWLARKAHRAS